MHCDSKERNYYRVDSDFHSSNAFDLMIRWGDYCCHHDNAVPLGGFQMNNHVDEMEERDRKEDYYAMNNHAEGNHG